MRKCGKRFEASPGFLLKLIVDKHIFKSFKTTTIAAKQVFSCFKRKRSVVTSRCCFYRFVISAYNTLRIDLAANIWRDGQGACGYNFCRHNTEITPSSHGTHVAGTIGAVNNNGIGVCGIAGGDGTPGSGVRLMSCQIFDEPGRDAATIDRSGSGWSSTVKSLCGTWVRLCCRPTGCRSG